MERVRLTPPEVAFSMAVAMQRNATKTNSSSVMANNHSSFGVHFAGAIGEVAFRKVYGGTVNQAVLPDGDKHQPDITLPDGRMVEVKTSTFSGKDVELKLKDSEMDFEWCSLVQIIGWPDTLNVFPIWKKEDMEFRRHNYGYGDRWVWSPDQGSLVDG